MHENENENEKTLFQRNNQEHFRVFSTIMHQANVAHTKMYSAELNGEHIFPSLICRLWNLEEFLSDFYFSIRKHAENQVEALLLGFHCTCT